MSCYYVSELGQRIRQKLCSHAELTKGRSSPSKPLRVSSNERNAWDRRKDTDRKL